MNKNIMIPLVTLMILAMVGAASAAEVTELEIRGEVKEGNTTNQLGPDDLEWDATNFAAFWYDLDDGTSTETLEIAATLDNVVRTLEEDELTYTTSPEPQMYEVCEEYNDVEIEDEIDYYIEGWLAEKYVAVNGNADILSKLLVEFEGDDKKTLSTGESWDLGSGFTLTAQQIDLDGNKVWFSISKDGAELDSEVIDASSDASNQQRTYVYTEDLAGEDDVPVFLCYVDAVFRGTDTNIVQVKFAFLIDNEVLEIDTGDEFGIMEATANSDQITLRNKEDTLTLDEDSKEHIMGDMYFKTADDSDNLRFYPMVEYTIGGVPTEEPVETATEVATEAEPAGNVTDGENVTDVGADEGTEPVENTTAEEVTTDVPETEEETEEEAEEETPGFEAVFAISGLLAIAYLVLRQRD